MFSEILRRFAPQDDRGGEKQDDRGERTGRSAFFSVTLSSSSLAYAVSILPKGKMHDLQGGSSSSQKSAGGDDRGGEHKAPRFYLVKSYYYSNPYHFVKSYWEARAS